MEMDSLLSPSQEEEKREFHKERSPGIPVRSDALVLKYPERPSPKK
jgi:hypothetical protein